MPAGGGFRGRAGRGPHRHLLFLKAAGLGRRARWGRRGSPAPGPRAPPPSTLSWFPAADPLLHVPRRNKSSPQEFEGRGPPTRPEGGRSVLSGGGGRVSPAAEALGPARSRRSAPRSAPRSGRPMGGEGEEVVCSHRVERIKKKWSPRSRLRAALFSRRSAGEGLGRGGPGPGAHFPHFLPNFHPSGEWAPRLWKCLLSS